MTSSGFRVLLPGNVSSEFLGKMTTIQKEDFKLIDQAPMTAVSLARTLMSAGATAGVIPETILASGIQAAFFDMDATVIAEESLVEISKVAGKFQEVDELTRLAMAGGMDFATSLRMRLKLLAGLHRDQVLSVKPHLNEGMRDLAASMRQRNVKLFLVSGGFVDLAKPVAEDLCFTDYKANRFVWNGDVLAGDAEGDIIDGDGKCDAVLEWCKRFGFDPKRCVAIGDGANDRKMMEVCGLAVGYRPKKALWNILSINNATGDHRLLDIALTP